MPTIVINHDPAGINKRETHEVPTGMRLLDWLVARYGPDGFSVPTRIYRDLIHPSTEIDLTEHKADGCPIEGVIHIVHTPLGIETVIIAAVVTFIVISSINIDIPDTPELVTPTESPNNRLTAQTNIARPLQRIPDIYGKNRVYPDLIAKPYNEYKTRKNILTEFFCIGRGEFLVEEVKTGDTLIDDVKGTDAEVFGPSVTPPLLLDVTGSNEVNGQRLWGPNDLLQTAVEFAIFLGPPSNSIVVTGTASGFEFFGQFEDGDQFSVAGSVTNDITFTIISQTVTPTSIIIFVIETVTPILIPISVTFTALSTVRSNSAGPFKVPGETEQVWVNLKLPNGLMTSGGGFHTLDIDTTLQRLDSGGAPVGAPEVTPIAIGDRTRDGFGITFKLTPVVPGDPYEITLTRLTNTSVGDLEVLKWEALSGVADVSALNFGNITTVLATTFQTPEATSTRKREINAVVTRKLVTYDTGTQTITVTPAATAKMADAVLDMITDAFMGNKPSSEIDLDLLYEIQEDNEGDVIYGDNLMRFCYTFSNEKTPVRDELKTVLNSARAFYWVEGQIAVFARDQVQTTRKTLFNRRNKRPDSEKRSITFQRPSDNDGISLSWTDEETGEAATIIFPESPSPTPTNPVKIKAAGIKNYPQAWNRAFYEWQRLQYQRTSVNTVVTKDGLLVRPNDRVANVDGTDIKTQDGEVLEALTAQTVIKTSESIDFDGNPTATVIFRDEDGVAQVPATCTPRLDGVNGFILSAPPGFTITIRSDTAQIGTLYSFAADSNHLANDYLVEEIAPGDDNGYVNLKLVNYAPEVYDPDTTVPT